MKITPESGIIEVVAKYPETVEVFQRYGMGCLGCAASRFENIAQGDAAHGIDADALVRDLETAVRTQAG